MKLLNQLTKKHLMMNKKRTIVTIIGVILSCALMMGVGLLFSSVYKNIEASILQDSGNYHVIFHDINRDDLKIVENNVNVKSIQYHQLLSYARVSDREDSILFTVNTADESYFKNLILEEGKYPTSNNEIVVPSYLKNYYDKEYHLGNEITFYFGKRYLDGKEVIGDEVDEKETWETMEEKTYKIVGFYDTIKNGNLSLSPCFIKEIESGQEYITAWVTFHSNRDIRRKTESIASHIGLEKDSKQIEYHEDLLSLYGQSKYGNYNKAMLSMVKIILLLVSVACIIVIYNSFQISVMERKKQFGLFASIGATKKQLRYTVFYEAFMIAIIGIPIGILGAYLGIDTVIYWINHFLPNEFDPPLTLAINPSFVIIPLIFILLVIFISALLPAIRASKVTPIEAIRQNDDIKIKGKKVETNKLVEKLFGVEGMIALKNMKRNKKKYRITIISIFISIVLFLSFSTILEYGMKGADNVFHKVDFDVSIYAQDRSKEKLEEITKQVIHHSAVEESVVSESTVYDIDVLKEEQYQPAYYEIQSKYLNEVTIDDKKSDELYVYRLRDENYQELKDKLHLDSDHPIFINHTVAEYIDENGDKKMYSGPIVKEDRISSIPVYWDILEHKEKKIEIENIYYTDYVPFGFKTLARQGQKILLINDTLYHELNEFSLQGEEPVIYSSEITLKVKDIDRFSKDLKKMEEDEVLEVFSVNNVVEGQKVQRNMFIVIQILLYGFITLVTLIGVTSVFNTINTSLILRKKEFGMLRSVGLTPHGFKKILWFESIFFVGKSLLYALPVSFLILLVIDHIIGKELIIGHILVPWKAVFLAILFAFIIVLITSIYSTSKMRKENILEEIRDENI